MKKIILLINVIIFITKIATSQNVQWAKLAIRSDNNDGVYSTSICFDQNQNTIISGYYYADLTSTINFDSESITGYQSSLFISHAFIAKYDSNGNILWVNRIGSTNGDTKITGITSDNNGNIYVIGDFTQSCKFGCSQNGDCSSEGTEIISSGFNDIFIAKYDSDGNFLWVKTINSPSNSINSSKIAFGTNTNSIYLCGKFAGSTSFGEVPSQVILNATGINDLFIASYSDSGALNWVVQAQGTNTSEIKSINIDSNENIFAVGTFNSQITFDTYILNASEGVDSQNPFLVKLNSSGNVIFAKSFDSSSDAVFNDVAVDYFDDNIYVTGTFSGNISFLSNTLLSEFGNENILLAKFDNDGNNIWSKKTGLRPDNTGGSSGIAIAGKELGFYLAGTYRLDCTFDLDTLHSFSTSNSNIFFSSYDSDGNNIFIERAGGADNDYLKDITSTIDENVAIASDSYGSNPSFPTLTYTINWGTFNLFPNKTSMVCSKIKFCTPITILTQPAPLNSQICPGDTVVFSISANGSQPISYQWYNFSGEIIDETNPSLSAFDENNYYCIASNECSSVNSDTVNITLKTESLAPTGFTFEPDAVCANTSTQVTFTATGGVQGTGANLEWFSDSCGGTVIGTGNPLTIDVNFAFNTQIFARYTGDCNTTSCYSETYQVDQEIPENPAMAIASRTTICPDDNGNIILRLLGTSTDEVFWYTNDCGSDFLISGSPVPVPAPGQTTTYYGRYENACGVSECQSVTVTVLAYPEAPTSIISDTNNVCSDYENNINLSALGGSGENIFWYINSCGGDSINNGTSIDIPIPDSTTTFYARWENMCGTSDCAELEFVVIPRADATITNPGLLCPSYPPTLIESAENGGIWNGDFIDPNTGLFDQNAAGSGQHLISYTIDGQCGDYDEIIIDVVQAFDATISNPGILCFFNDTIILSAATDGGSWSGEGIINDSSGIFSPSLVGIGQYTVYYENTDFCGDRDSILLNVIGKINAQITSPDFYCNNQDTVILTAEPAGGIWYGENIEPDGTFVPLNAMPDTIPITYIVPGDCGDTVQKNIIIYEKIFSNITTPPDICIRDTIIQLEGTPSGGIWIGESIDSVSGILDMSNLEPDNYQIIYIFDQNCGDSDTLEITIHPYFNTHIWYDDSVFNDSPAFLINREQDGGIWEGIGVDENGLFDPAISSFGEFMIIYSYDDGYCYEADTLILKVHFRPYSDLIIPNIISPNADNHNDLWDIKGIENYEFVNIKIYTRWGNEVFSYSGSAEGYNHPEAQWDGKYKGKNLPDGGYLYILEINHETNFKGTISLIR